MTIPVENAGVQTGAEDDDAAAQAALADAAGAQEADAGIDEDALDPKVRAKLDKANREAIALRARVKTLEPAAKELEKLRQGEMSELERAKAVLAEREAQINSMTVSAFRRDAALAAGLDAEMVEFITGDTEEEATAQAQKLAKRLKASEPKKPGSPDLKQGQRGSAPSPTQDRNALIRQMAGFTP